ncbi:MAG: F0F1 ATP synthase subunit epsilon [Proteobacteria bacterium]|jgi:F-type H+-transporting ATPase subunit epsilon|nr:F0F1 ATP synthase subunit epsilon [Pseudomonadota bacterium]
MKRPLHLVLTTAQQLLLDAADVVAVRGEDASGCFGILGGHADLITVLVPSVLRMSGGAQLHVACRGAVRGDSIEKLETAVRAARAEQLNEERRARVEQMQLHTRTLRTLVRYLHPATRHVES